VNHRPAGGLRSLIRHVSMDSEVVKPSQHRLQGRLLAVHEVLVLCGSLREHLLAHLHTTRPLLPSPQQIPLHPRASWMGLI
jgi:hypothetical protein